VQFENEQIIEYNKEKITSFMHYIDYGLGVLKASTFSSYPSGVPLDLSRVYNELSLHKQLAGHEVFKRFYEIGSHQGIADTQKYLLQKITKDTL
jgi:hypothetical protein